MRNERKGWRLASIRGLAALMAVTTVFQLRPASAAPADVFSIPAPAVGSDAPKAADVKDGDVSVSTETGAMTWSYPIAVAAGRNGMVPHIALSYSSQAPTYGGIAAGWSLSIPDIKEDTSQGRLRTHYKLNGPDSPLDDRFVSGLAGGRPLILVDEPEADPDAYHYRAQNDSSFARYDRMKPGHDGDFKWRVFTTDGTTRYFGEYLPTSKCAHISEGYAPLTREVDEFGSEVDYTYENGVQDECVIGKIEWGKNGASHPHFAAVELAWSVSTPSSCPSGTIAGQSVDYSRGVRIVTGASTLTTITATAYAPGSSPTAAQHTRTITLGYDATEAGCENPQHAPLRLLTTIDETASGTTEDGVVLPSVTLPQKRFAYNPATVSLASSTNEGQAPWLGAEAASDDPSDAFEANANNLGWGYRYNDARWPSVEGMSLDVDGDGLPDRVFNDPIKNGGNIADCRAGWVKNTGPGTDGKVHFAGPVRHISLPRLKWRGTESTQSPQGGSGASIADLEGCALNGQRTAYRNSHEATGCHDGTDCSTASDPNFHESFCNIAEGKGTECAPGAGGAGGQNPDTSPFLTYLAYRWLDVDGDSLPDLVAAVHGDIDVYDIEKGNTLGYSCPAGFPSSCGSDAGVCATCGEPALPMGIPGFGEWPPCPENHDVCFNPGSIGPDGLTCANGTCEPNWTVFANALNAASHVGCARFMEKRPPSGPPSGTSGGGASLSMSRQPYQRCQGLYPWLIYKNLGNGVFATTPTIKYQPVPLESDSGDSALTGPAIASQNHAVMDFDGDGVLDAVVRKDNCYYDPHDPHPGSELCDPNAPDVAGNYWNVFLGDRTGQLGPKGYLYPTRTHDLSFLSGIGTKNGPFALSSAGLLDVNGDGLPDHWYGHIADNSDIAFHVGLYQLLAQTSPPGTTGTLETPSSPVPVKPGNDSGFPSYTGLNPQVPADVHDGESRAMNRVLDADGDGRVDVLRWGVSPRYPGWGVPQTWNSDPQVLFNLGEQFLWQPQTYSGSSLAANRTVRVDFNAPPLDPPVWQLTSDVVDLDGDGLGEAVFFNGSMNRAKPSTPAPRLLKKIENGRGAWTEITYSTMHVAVEQEPGKSSPHNQWVVASVSSCDRFTPGTVTTAACDVNNPGAATSSYKYKDPHFGPDDEGKYAFRGFEEVTSTGPSGARTIQRYSFAPDWSGRLVETVVKPKVGSGEGDDDARSIDRTTWQKLLLFSGTVNVFLGTQSEHLVCANGQTDPAEQHANPCTSTSAAGYSLTATT